MDTDARIIRKAPTTCYPATFASLKAQLVDRTAEGICKPGIGHEKVRLLGFSYITYPRGDLLESTGDLFVVGATNRMKSFPALCGAGAIRLRPKS